MTTTGGNILTVPMGKVVTRPDLFQFRDDAGGYDKDTVDTLVRTWDWNRYDPVSVVRDPSTGEMIVIGGHHRYEAIRRLPDENPEQAAESVQVRVIEGDIGDSDSRADLQRQAILSNYSVRGTSLLADSEAVKRFEAEGQSPKEIADAMNERRTSKVRDLSAFGELHLGDRQFVQTVPDFYPVAVELGHAVKRGMSPDEAGALLLNIRKDYDETGRLPSRAVVKSLTRLKGVTEDAGQQAGFALGDTSAYNAVRQMAAENTAMEAEISKLRRELQICERLGETTHVDVSEMRVPILARLAELQGTLDARNESLLRGGELPPAPGPFTVDRRSGDGAGPTMPEFGEAPAETPDEYGMTDSERAEFWETTREAYRPAEDEPVQDNDEPAPFTQSGPGLFDTTPPPGEKDEDSDTDSLFDDIAADMTRRRTEESANEDVYARQADLDEARARYQEAREAYARASAEYNPLNPPKGKGAPTKRKAFTDAADALDQAQFDQDKAEQLLGLAIRNSIDDDMVRQPGEGPVDPKEIADRKARMARSVTQMADEPAPFEQSGSGLFEAPEPEPSPGMGQATMGDEFATNRTLGMPMGEGRAMAAPLVDPAALQAEQERRDAIAAGQTELAGVDTDFDGVPDVSLEDSDGDGLPDEMDAVDDRGHDDVDALQEAAVMVGRDPETGEEVKVAAYKVDDGLIAIEVQSDGEPGPLFEAASEAAMEVAAETPADTAPPLSDTWRQDFEESLSVLNDETFEGDEDWTDLRNYIDEIQASRVDLAGTEVLAWADRWESEAQGPGATDTSDAVRDLRDSLEVSLGVKPAPVAPSPRNALEMFGVSATETSAAPAKGKRRRRGKKAKSGDILTERAGATAVVPPPGLVMR